jgi:nicotinamide-nucleotide amidase
LIATRLTDVPGSSAYFVQGLVTYANEAKERLLGVAAGLLREHGAVSEPVAEAMADRCRKISGTDYALSVTGIAGPTGATADKPIGLVYVALAGPAGVKARELRLGATLTRAQVRDRAAKAALNMLRLQLLA